VFERYSRQFADHFRSIFDTESAGRVILYSPIVGIISGLVAVAFYLLLQGFSTWALQGVVDSAGAAELTGSVAGRWLATLLIPAAGGLCCGFLVYRFAPEAEGHGTDAMVRSFHRDRGRIRGRVPLVKGLASILTIGTGGSAGREGPIAQIGAGFASFMAEKLGLGEQDRRQLMLAGAAGGIGAIFHAPLGGALFVTEVCYGSTALEFAAVIPAVIASISAYTVLATILGHGLAINITQHLEFTRPAEIPLYLVFAILCSLVGYLYVKVFYGLRNKVFRKISVPNTFKPAIGGLFLGAMAISLPEVMGGGYGTIQRAIDGDLTIRVLVFLCAAKIVATSLTISSGGSGGVFAPSLFIGAMLGGAYAQICNQVLPGAIEQPEAFVLVGMGGFFAGVAKVPLTAVLMVCEMTGSYGLLVPLMIVSIVNVALLSSRWTLYEEQVPTIVDSPAHQGDFIVDVLEQIRVRDVLRHDQPLELVPESTPLPEILRLVARSQNTYFPVVDDNQRLVAIFSLRDLRSVLTGHGAGSLVVAIDVATQPVLTVTPDDDLHTALRRFTLKNIASLPVVDAQDSGQILGMLSRKDLTSAYHDRVTLLQCTNGLPGES